MAAITWGGAAALDQAAHEQLAEAVERVALRDARRVQPLADLVAQAFLRVRDVPLIMPDEEARTENAFPPRRFEAGVQFVTIGTWATYPLPPRSPFSW